MEPAAGTPPPRNPAYIDGRTVLVHQGPADMVRLATFMPRFPSPLDFSRIESGDGHRWEIALDLPARARIEYRLEVTDGRRTTSILDPLNPEVATNPFGANSVVTGPGHAAPWWRSETGPPGTVREVRVRSAAFGSRRHHHVYTPHGSDADSPLPLVVVHDGSDYFDHARLGDCLDTLISHEVIPPLRVLMFDPVHRNQEYVANRRHARHLVDETLPHVRKRFATIGLPFVMGASLGAVASWHASWTHAGEFAGMFLQSGTFAFDESPLLDDDMATPIRRFVTAANADPRVDARPVVITCGRYESLIDWNRRVAATLAGRCDLRYRERWTGHDWGAWADEFEAGFLHLLTAGESHDASTAGATEPASVAGAHHLGSEP